MNTTGGHSAVLAALESSVCRDPAIEFAVAFGSHVTGDSRPSSDLDIAVRFTDELSASERFRKRCSLSGTLQREDAPFIDISDLDELPLTVAHDAVHGTFICGDEQAFRDVTSEIETAFAEQGDEIRRRQRALIDRIAEEGLRG
jgi:predicted nucleotidyltransferase